MANQDEKSRAPPIEAETSSADDGSTREVTVPQDQPTSTTNNAKDRIEATSEERTRALKAARDAALGQTASSSSTTASMASTSPAQTTRSQTYPPSNLYPPAPTRPMHPPAFPGYSRRSGLIVGLQRLAYILSILLGSSAIIGLFWSTFLLPLLHSSFSARQVLLEQQTSRLASLVNGLKALRSSPMFPKAPSRTDEVEPHDEDIKDEEQKMIQDVEHKSGIEEISPSESPSTSSRCSSPDGKGEHGLTTTVPLLPLDDLATLSNSLKSLSGAISSTSTTRVSLLSTLESYTSQLHREVYLRTDPKSHFSVGLESLSQNLANASGASASTANKDGRTEWDDVRKEIRAIKGLLLGRRNFAPQTNPVRA